MTDHDGQRGPLASLFWPVLEWISMVLGLSGLGLLCLVWLPFAMVLHLLLPRRWGQPLGRWVIMAGFRVYLAFLWPCGFRFDLAALDALRRDGPLVLVANHPSLLDIVMIASRFPDLVCIMKAALLKNPLLGAASRLARYIPNNAPLAVVLDACAELQGGAKLLLFPEGTRTCRLPVDTCTPGAGLIAGRARVPVQALLIEFNAPYLGKAWPLFRRPRLPVRCSIRVGRRFEPPTDATAFAAELEAYFRAVLPAPPPA